MLRGEVRKSTKAIPEMVGHIDRRSRRGRRYRPPMRPAQRPGIAPRRPPAARGAVALTTRPAYPGSFRLIGIHPSCSISIGLFIPTRRCRGIAPAAPGPRGAGARAGSVPPCCTCYDASSTSTRLCSLIAWLLVKMRLMRRRVLRSGSLFHKAPGREVLLALLARSARRRLARRSPPGCRMGDPERIFQGFGVGRLEALARVGVARPGSESAAPPRHGSPRGCRGIRAG